MFLSKYGVARHIFVPVVKRAVVDFAVGADWTPAAGDVKISKDGGSAANVTNLPAAIAMGNTAYWDFSLTATEMQAAQVVVTVADSATKAVEDQAFIIETYGSASGQHAWGNVGNVKKNTALATFPFMMTDSTGHAPATGKTVTCTRSIDGGAFGSGSLANITEVGNGIYTVDFAAGDLNGNCIILRATASGCDDTFERIVTAV